MTKAGLPRGRPARGLPLGVALLLALFGTTVRAADLQVSARLEPATIGLDEAATLEIEVTSTGLSAPLQGEPDFALENLEIVGGPARSESLRFVNGHASRSLMFSWNVRPKAVGPARVHSIRVTIGGVTRDLAPQQITVQQEPSGTAPTTDPFAGDPFQDFFGRFRRPGDPRLRRALGARPKIFMRAAAVPAQPYAGQQVLYTVYLYTQNDVTALAPRNVPAFSGFWVVEVPQPERQPQPDMVVEDGERYARVPIFQRALFPIQSGPLEIPAFAADIGIRVATPSAFGLIANHEEVRRQTAPITITALALPPSPAGFNGAVGRLELAARLEPPQVESGAAATLTLTLSGQGHVAGLPDPELPALSGLRVYPPQKESKEDVVGTMVRGSRTWSYVLVPQHEGTFELPRLAIPYFDPGKQVYAEAAAPALTLLAVPNPAAPAPATTAPAAETASPPRAGAQWLRDHTASIAAALGGLMLIGTIAALVRNRAGAGGSARRGALAAAVKAAHLERPRQAAAALEEAWRTYLHDRYELPRGTPSPQWRDLLTQRGADAGYASALQKLADDLHYLRYAPQLAAAETLRDEVVRHSRKLLRGSR